MAFDVIVFSQEELECALAAGIRSIALCDNSFTLPDIDGIHYTIIGSVSIEGMDTPKHKEDKPSEEIPVYASVENKTLSLSSSFNGSFAGSFASSYGGFAGNGSFSGGSMQGSYAYEYEYELASSYGASFASSFASSYMSEYSSSYQTSFSSSFYSFISGMSFEFGSFGLSSSFGLGYSFEFGGSFGYEYSGSYTESYGGSANGSYTPLPDIIEYGSSGIIFVNGYGINLI